jgi:hypothetical protein
VKLASARTPRIRLFGFGVPAPGSAKAGGHRAIAAETDHAGKTGRTGTTEAIGHWNGR